jgi:hypothetical protein
VHGRHVYTGAARWYQARLLASLLFTEPYDTRHPRAARRYDSVRSNLSNVNTATVLTVTDRWSDCELRHAPSAR